jgi:hypothetical protein
LIFAAAVWTSMTVAGEADTKPPAIFFKRKVCKDAHYI